jgi:uncharacterized membrane protein
MKPEKTEKIFGYALNIIGLVLIIIPVILSFLMLLGVMVVPQLVSTPADETDGFVRALIIFSNVCAVFFVFIIIVWAGSILTSRGATMVKSVKFKLIRKSLKEVGQAMDKAESENSS